MVSKRRYDETESSVCSGNFTAFTAPFFRRLRTWSSQCVPTLPPPRSVKWRPCCCRCFSAHPVPHERNPCLRCGTDPGAWQIYAADASAFPSGPLSPFSAMKKLLLLLIRAYQIVLSPLLPPACRFHPTCSHYAMEAISQHGPLKGAVLTSRRLLRCHPFCKGGFDPVPPAAASKLPAGAKPPLTDQTSLRAGRTLRS